jgi:hypothetical protein
MPTLSLNPACPGWPAEKTDSGRRLRRFVGVSLLAHGLVLSMHFQFWPFFEGDRSIRPLSVQLKSASQVSENAPGPLPDSRQLAAGRPSQGLAERPAGPMEASPRPPEPTTSRSDTQAMIARGKADIEADSRRQMLDPMFAAAARQPATVTPLERATAARAQTVEQLAGQLVRVTTADGRRYCLQGLPEAATRDIPTPVLSIPMNCP